MTTDRIRRFSPSSLQSYRNCPLQFKLRYADREALKPPSIEAVLGICVHRALEEVYLARSRGRVMEASEMLGVYEAEWARAFKKEVRFVAGGEPEEWHRLGVECLRGYYRDNAPFDADRTVGVERHVGFQLEVSDGGGGDLVTVHGYVDRLSIGRDGVFEIHDYKTSRSLPSVEEKEADWQLAIYASALRRLWPGIGEVRLVWHFLRHGQKVVVVNLPERQAALEKDVGDLVLRIWRDQDAGGFAHVKSALCDWCDFQDSCPAWKHLKAYEQLPEDERKHESGVKLVDEYAALEARKKELRGELAAVEEDEKKVASALIEYAARHKVSALAGTDFEAEVHERDEVKFPTKTAAPDRFERMEAELKASPVWPEVSRVDTRAVLELQRAGRLAAEQLEGLKQWIERWGRHEKHQNVRLRKRKETADE